MTTLSAVAPRPWPARIGTLAIFFANGIGIGSWAAAIPQLKGGLALSDAQLSLVLLALAAGAIVLMPFAGVLAPRLGGTGRALRYGSVMFALALCLPGLAPSLPVLIGSALLLGAFNGLMEVPMNAHATVVERGWGAAIMSSFHAAWSCGGLVGASLGGVLIHAGVGMPWELILAGALVLAVVVAAGTQIGEGETSGREGPAFAWPERRLVGLCIIALLGMMMEGAIADWSAVYLNSVVRLDTAAAAGGYAAFAFAMLLGRMFGDPVVRAFGRRRVIMLGAIVAGVGLLLAIVGASPVLAVAGFGLVGLGLSNMVPAVFSASAAMTASPALGISMAATVGYAGFLIGPPIIGGIATYAGLRAGFTLLILAMAATVAIAARQPRTT